MARKKFKDYTLQKYLDVLASRQPIPGGGSASALVAAMGTALLSMVAHYSIGKGKPKDIEKQLKELLRASEKMRQRFLHLVDLDADAYLKIVEARHKSPKEQAKANKEASKVSFEICHNCFKTMDLMPVLVQHGNQRLISDIEAALEMLLAAFNSSMAMIQANQ